MQVVVEQEKRNDAIEITIRIYYFLDIPTNAILNKRCQGIPWKGKQLVTRYVISMENESCL